MCSSSVPRTSAITRPLRTTPTRAARTRRAPEGPEPLWGFYGYAPSTRLQRAYGAPRADPRFRRATEFERPGSGCYGGSALVSRSRSAVAWEGELVPARQVNGQILVAGDKLALEAGLLQSMAREPVTIGELVRKSPSRVGRSNMITDPPVLTIRREIDRIDPQQV